MQAPGGVPVPGMPGGMDMRSGGGHMGMNPMQRMSHPAGQMQSPLNHELNV